MDNNLINFLNSIVKPRDFIFSIFSSVPIFIIESFNDSFIPFMEVSDSSIVAAVIGLGISKLNDLTYIKSLEQNKPLVKYKKLIKRLKKEIAKSEYTEEKKQLYSSLKVDSETTLEFFKDEFIDEAELNERFQKLIVRFENLQNN